MLGALLATDPPSISGSRYRFLVVLWNDHVLVVAFLLPDHVCAAFLAHPHLVSPPSIDIQPTSDTKCFLGRLCVVRVGDSQFTLEDQVRGKTRVLMRRVMGVASAHGQHKMYYEEAHVVRLRTARLTT